MRINLFKIMVVTTMILLSCQEKDALSHYVVKSSIVEIAVDSVSFNGYDVYDIINDNEVRLVGYNESTHSIDFFNITTRKQEERLLLDLNGPDGMGYITNLDFHNKDSIFAYSSSSRELYIFNEGGEVFWRLSVFDLMELNEITFMPIVNNHFKLKFLKKINSIPLYNLHVGDENNYGSYPQISFLNIRTLEVTPVDVFHSEPYDDVGDFGHLNYLSFSDFSENKIYINHLYSGKVIGIDYLDDFSISSEFYREFNNQHVKSVNYWSDHAVTSRFYNDVLCTSDRFFQFIWNSAQVEGENPFLDKKYSLGIWSSNFEYHSEVELSNDIFPYSWNNVGDSTFAMLNHPNNDKIDEDLLQILILSIE